MLSAQIQRRIDNTGNDYSNDNKMTVKHWQMPQYVTDEKREKVKTLTRVIISE